MTTFSASPRLNIPSRAGGPTGQFDDQALQENFLAIQRWADRLYFDTSIGDHAATTYYGDGVHDLVNASVGYIDLDTTNVPALSVYATTGDVIDLIISAMWSQAVAGQPIGVDWLITLPDSSTTNLRKTGFSAGTIELGNAATDGNSIPVYANYTCVQSGIHSFKPQWRSSAGAIAKVILTGTYAAPIFHRVKVL